MQLTVLLGAPGAGKTTLLSHLRERTGLLVADMDEILEEGVLLGVPVASEDAASHWPAYNRLWVRIVSMMTRADVPVVLCAPVTPVEWDRAVTEVGLPLPTAFVLLDCADDVRSARLTARGWSSARIGDALADAAALRTFGLPVLDSSSRPVADVADGLSCLLVPDRGPDAG